MQEQFHSEERSSEQNRRYFRAGLLSTRPKGGIPPSAPNDTYIGNNPRNNNNDTTTRTWRHLRLDDAQLRVRLPPFSAFLFTAVADFSSYRPPRPHECKVVAKNSCAIATLPPEFKTGLETIRNVERFRQKSVHTSDKGKSENFTGFRLPRISVYSEISYILTPAAMPERDKIG
ncbi:Hypothetical protein NTJ_15544 [Nesidiocoris tenuis]|uniref:Uncharacterized protein n=1 Tax=Nesidiocoris tenuis TaxID=355587 RepID=A0ABN7BEI5_9HEMI|nr:Hypothetical protein NTJ_15544 [Nesidiocoris tenuis]